LRAIATEVGLSKSGVRQTLLSAGVALRAHSNDQIKSGKASKATSIRNAPYGYCLVNRRLLEDPREMAVVQLMLQWWRDGMSLGAIARRLNSQKIKPRKAASWSQPTVGFIIQRQSNKLRR